MTAKLQNEKLQALIDAAGIIEEKRKKCSLESSDRVWCILLHAGNYIDKQVAEELA